METLACFDSLDFYDATWLRPYGVGGMHPKLAIANEPVDEDLSHSEIFFVNEGNFALNQRQGARVAALRIGGTDRPLMAGVVLQSSGQAGHSSWFATRCLSCG